MSTYKQRPRVQKIFLQYVMSLKSAIGEYGNPLLETSTDILVLDTRDIVEKSVITNVYRIETLGCHQYDNIHLFSTPHKRQKTKTSGHVSSLKSDRNFSRDCMLHLSFVMVTSVIISLDRINHVHHHYQTEGNSNWAPNWTLFDA